MQTTLNWRRKLMAKTQVTIEYLQRASGYVELLRIHTNVISTQNAEPLKTTRSKEVSGYNGPDTTAPSMEEMNKLIVYKVLGRINRQSPDVAAGVHIGKDELDGDADDQDITF